MAHDTQRTLILLTEALASTKGPEARLRLVLREMIEAVGALGGQLSHWSSASRELLPGPATFPLDPADQRRFHANHAHLFPHLFASGLGMKFFAEVPKVGVAEEMLGVEAWHSSEYYQVCVAPFALDSHLLVTTPAPGGPWMMVLVFPHGHRPPRNCVEFLRALRPHVGRALSRLAQFPDPLFPADGPRALAACQREPIVALRLGDKGRPARLIAATGGAAEIVRLHSVAGGRNLELAELLRLCPTALRLDAGRVVWTSHDGEQFAVESARSDSDHTVLLARLKRLRAPDTAGASGTRAALACGLSPREAEVYVLLAQGLTNRQIALKLSISPHTARTHVNNICKVLEVSGRVEAINKVRVEARAQHDGSDWSI